MVPCWMRGVTPASWKTSLQISSPSAVQQRQGLFVEVLVVCDASFLTTFANGFASNIGGLYMSCKTIHGEMETLIMKLHPILDLKHAWDTQRKRKDVLRFQLPPDFPFATTPTHLTIAIPMGSFSEIQDSWLDCNNRPGGAGELLTSALQLPLTCLTFKLYRRDDPPKGRYPWMYGLLVMYFILGSQYEKWRFEKTDRVIFQCDTRPPRYDMYCKGKIATMISKICRDQAMVELKTAWCSKAASHLGRLKVWQVGFDFKTGLPMPEGEDYCHMPVQGPK